MTIKQQANTKNSPANGESPRGGITKGKTHSLKIQRRESSDESMLRRVSALLRESGQGAVSELLDKTASAGPRGKRNVERLQTQPKTGEQTEEVPEKDEGAVKQNLEKQNSDEQPEHGDLPPPWCKSRQQRMKWAMSKQERQGTADDEHTGAYDRLLVHGS